MQASGSKNAVTKQITKCAEQMKVGNKINDVKVGDMVRLCSLVDSEARKNKIFKKKYLLNYKNEVHKVVASRDDFIYIEGDDKSYYPKDVLKVEPEVIESVRQNRPVHFHNREEQLQRLHNADIIRNEPPAGNISENEEFGNADQFD